MNFGGLKVANKLPLCDYLHEALRYADGYLFWRIRPRNHFDCGRTWNMWNAKYAGKRAGRRMPTGSYRQVMVNGCRFLEHRVIAAMFGVDLSGEIDHVDGNGLNNRIENLRAASRSQNTKNNSGWRCRAARVGTFKKPNGKWIAYIRAYGRHKHLGAFYAESEAVAARLEAERFYYGEFAVSHSRRGMAA